jgi:prepilin-type N-terminal cleavage/methylation domain-containing protein
LIKLQNSSSPEVTILFTEFSNFQEICSKRRFKMKSKGFTLIELAVVLAIIAVLAAVLTPMVSGYIDQARITRAQADAKAIASAVQSYKSDTGFWPIYSTYANAQLDTLTNADELLIGPGNTPTQKAMSGFDTLVSGHAPLSLSTYLNTNQLTGTPGVPTVTTNQSSVPGHVAWKGPYLPGLDSDPWGNAYIVTALYLQRSDTTHVAYVISAGPNGQLDTASAQTNSAVVQGATSTTSFPSVDDIVAVVASKGQ